LSIQNNFVPLHHNNKTKGDKDMEIKQNYKNYEKVKNAFHRFISALIWESVELDDGSTEIEVEEAIEKYCKANADQMIVLTNDSVRKFVTSLTSRYKVTYYECGENKNIEVNVCSISSDNLEVMLKKAAKFYRNGKRPYVEVFDNVTKKFVAKWDYYE
jgi:hypothetical protein